MDAEKLALDMAEVKTDLKHVISILGTEDSGLLKRVRGLERFQNWFVSLGTIGVAVVGVWAKKDGGS